MNKQITYPKLVPRLFATNIDFSLLAITAYFIHSVLIKFGYGELPFSNGLFQFSLIAVYFLSFWCYKGTTPGKMLMHMKIVDAKTFQPPTKFQLIIRFFATSLFLIGIWFIPLTRQNQALHDKIAGTAVIKV